MPQNDRDNDHVALLSGDYAITHRQGSAVGLSSEVQTTSPLDTMIEDYSRRRLMRQALRLATSVFCEPTRHMKMFIACNRIKTMTSAVQETGLKWA